MAKILGSEIVVSLGMESLAAPGIAVAPTITFPVTEFSFQPITDKTTLNVARGPRLEVAAAKIRRRYARGSFKCPIEVTTLPYLMAMALCNFSSSAVADSAYTHTGKIQNNGTPRTATMVVEYGTLETKQFTNVVVESINIDCKSDGVLEANISFASKYPTTGSYVESLSQIKPFVLADVTAQFGSNYTTARAASVTPLKNFSLNIKTGVVLDEAFMSGSVDIANGGISFGRFSADGNYSLHFESTAELDKYRNNVNDALILTATGDLIGATSKEKVEIALPKLVYNKAPLEVKIDGIVVLNQEFSVMYDYTDELAVTMVNKVNNASTNVYTKA